MKLKCPLFMEHPVYDIFSVYHLFTFVWLIFFPNARNPQHTSFICKEVEFNV